MCIHLDKKNSCLHQRNLVDGILFVVSCGALQQILLAQLFVCKQVSLVWQPWRSLWWNVLRQSSLGLPISLPRELGMCGATSWLLLVLSACTCAWSRLALHMLGIWCLSWKKLWRETCGMAFEGRPVSNAVGEQELEKRAAVFRTSASFWEIGVHEWETNDVPSRATYTEKVKEPQWQASDFMVCTRHEM